VNEQRVLKFKERVTAAVQSGEGQPFQELLAQMETEQNIPVIEIAAALAALLQGGKPFLLDPKQGARETQGVPKAWVRESANDTPQAATRSKAPAAREPSAEREQRTERAPPRAEFEPPAESEASAEAERGEPGVREERAPRPKRIEDGPPMETYRVEVGHAHGVLPGNIVGAIANEAGLDGKHIGHIDIRDDHTFVDLPEGMPKEIFRELKKVRVRGVELNITKVDSKPPRPERTGHSVRPRDDRAPRGPRFDKSAGGGFNRPGAAPGGGFKRHGAPSGGGHGPRSGKPKPHRKPSPSREH
jgi:ATP-dependent RNA helicase DeaD